MGAEKKGSKRKKIVRIVVIAAILVVVILLAAIYGIWHNELSTLASMEKVNEADEDNLEGNVYWIEVSGGYYFEELLEQGGVSSDTELISFITENITKGLIPMSISESELGCSSFTSVTEDGDRLFSRNYDMTSTNTGLVITDPGDGRHASVSTVDLQFLGLGTDSDTDSLMSRITMLAAPYVAMDGMNDAGVAVSIHMSYQGADDDSIPTDQQTDQADMTSTMVMRLILDYADSVEEAVELVSAYDLHESANCSFHYMVADSTGKSAILEWINVDATDSTDTDGTKRTLQVTWCGEEDFQVMTNFIIADGYYEEGAEDDMKGLDRYEYICSALEESDGIVEDEEAALEILEAVGRRTWNPDGSIVTVHSVVYNLTDRTATWVSNEHYGEEAFTYYLSVE